jgi:cystathionine beta-lyase
MQRHCENGASVANFLQSCDAVDKVLWPGFKNHKNHDIASRQMHGFGGMISFSLKEDTKEAAIKVLKKFKLFTLAESLGGVESLCGHPASMTHASIPKAEREKVGLSDSLIRLSVGVEDIEDLIVDLKQALS